MLDDIYVDGTSFASGWGKGYTDIGYVKLNPESWIQYFSNKVNASNVWNYSLSGKPLDMQLYDIKNFCNAYYKKFKTFDKLFVIVEYSYITYKTFKPLTIQEGEYKGDMAHPVTIAKPSTIANLLSDMEYIIMYIRRSNEYFVQQDAVFSLIKPENLNQNEISLLKHSINEWYKGVDKCIIKYLEYAYKHIFYIKTFLTNRNIPYIIFSAGVYTGDNLETIQLKDNYLNELYRDNRVVPMRNFTGLTLSMNYSKKLFLNHPDKYGHQAISDHVYNWIMKYELYKKPKTSTIILPTSTSLVL